MLRWIAFDAVGTLLFPEPDVATAYALIGQKYGSPLTPDDVRPRFRQYFAESTAACLPVEGGDVLTSESLERERWRWIVERVLPDVVDADGCFEELYEHFARSANWRLFPDVGETLARLRTKGMRIAMASNFDRRLHDVCRGFAQLDAVERIVVSTELGVSKPSSRFYAGLLSACGCGGEELAMVGDDWEADVAGPQRAGIRAVLLDREGSERRSAPVVIRSLHDLEVERLAEG